MRKDVFDQAAARRTNVPPALPSVFCGFGPEDRALLEEALSALLAERSRAFRIAHDVAIAQRRTPPSVDEFELSGILRLQRAIAGQCP
ncbi:hypothetical protein OKW34_005537 [Paraburkholderia youngii]|uniref:hypothetical protein n=1 Tax=Paraburkholderia youngii TaxID=2782701 RepID=UPI003D1CC827